MLADKYLWSAIMTLAALGLMALFGLLHVHGNTLEQVARQQVEIERLQLQVEMTNAILRSTTAKADMSLKTSSSYVPLGSTEGQQMAFPFGR